LCIKATFNGAHRPKRLKIHYRLAWWSDDKPPKRSYKWLNGFVDFLQEWLDELEGK
ncbi:hypothetical protein LCGC14_2273040, partial [marine sediment metagenome]